MPEEALEWLPASCELEDLSDIGGRLLPQLMLRIQIRSIGGGMDPRTRACLVNLVRLRDKAAGDWEAARAAADRYVEEQRERIGASGVTVAAWHALTVSVEGTKRT